MKWMLIVLVFGSAPVKTDLLFDSLGECLAAEDRIRSEYAKAFNDWLAGWGRDNPGTFPGSQDFVRRRVGLHNQMTCIAHSAN
jgi:hypothetical protein